MKIKVTSAIKDYQNNPLHEGDKPKAPVLTFRIVSSLALNSVIPDEQFTAEKKSQIFELSKKLWSADEVDLTAEEAALIKERSGILLPVLWHGRICELLQAK